MLHQKVGFIGFGNMGQSVVERLLAEKVLKPQQIAVSNRSDKKLQKAESLGIMTFKNNEELIEAVDIVVLGVKPQDILQVLEEVESVFHSSQIVISLAAGVSIEKLQKNIHETRRIVRAMPNTPISLGKGVIGYCLSENDAATEAVVEDLLEPLGYVVKLDEGEEFEALTVACGSGTGFVFELMQYWQEWVESYGFSPEVARKMTVQTFLGASVLADQTDVSISELQDRVVSRKGVTHAGLESMRSHEMDSALRMSFEKAVMRDRELGR